MAKISVLFAGDFAPCRGYENLVLQIKNKIFGDALQLIKDADISFVNLECPLTTSFNPIFKSGPTLKAHPETIQAIKDFSVIGLANNHIYDYGKEGLQDTLDVCHRNNLKTVGAGLTLQEAQRVHVIENKGVKIAILAVAEHEFNQSESGGAGSAPLDIIDIYHQITNIKQVADIVILTLHGGNEYFPFPRPSLRKQCKYFIDLGVDAVICHHPHLPGAYEEHNGKPIYFSIGNLVFDTPSPRQGWNEGFFVKLLFDVKSRQLKSHSIIPYTQSVENQGVKLMQGSNKNNFISNIENYKNNLENTEKYLEIWANFVRQNHSNYILKFFSPLHFRGIGFLVKKFPFLLDLLFGKRKMDLHRLNIIRCQSHLELLSEVLKTQLGHKYR